MQVTLSTMLGMNVTCYVNIQFILILYRFIIVISQFILWFVFIQLPKLLDILHVLQNIKQNVN